MGYTISSQVFFTQNYENVLEIYTLWEYFKNISRIWLAEITTQWNQYFWKINCLLMIYSILDMFPPPRMEIREVLFELQSTVSNKWPARPTRMQSWQSWSIMSRNRRCHWARVCCFCEIAGAMRPSILELESLVMPVNLGFLFLCVFWGYHMHAADLIMLFGVPMLTLVRLDRFHELICRLSPVLTTRNSRPVK